MFVICGLFMLQYAFSIPSLLRISIMKWCCILSNAFSASVEVIIWLLSFSLLIWCIAFIDLRVLNHPRIPGINPTWSWCTILLMSSWILFANILLRIFASMFIRDIDLYFSCSVLIWLWYQDNYGLTEWVWKCSLLFNFLEMVKKDWH